MQVNSRSKPNRQRHVLVIRHVETHHETGEKSGRRQQRDFHGILT